MRFTFFILGGFFFPTKAQGFICRQALQTEDHANGGGLPSSSKTATQTEFLRTNVDPYGKGLPRETHETEREGQLYPIGEKFNARLDENGKLRKDGRYLFAVARDIDGVRRIMTVPRFDFERADGKFLSTHRSMFRKYSDVFGPTPQIEVMGELEIRQGMVTGYNSKAGTAFDVSEAQNPALFNARKEIAESMGIDLTKADRVINYAKTVALNQNEQKRELGRHLDEETYVEAALAMRKDPTTALLLKKYDDLIHRAYTLFPEETAPKRIIRMDSPLLEGFEIPKELEGPMLGDMSAIQEDSPVAMISGKVINNEEGALGFAKNLDMLEQILLYAENKKNGQATHNVDWETWKGPLEIQYTAMLKSSTNTTYQTMRSRLLELSEIKIDPIEARKMLKVGEWPVKEEYKYLILSGQSHKLMDAQFLISNIQERFKANDKEGTFDFERFSKEVQLLEEDQLIDENVARKMILELIVESKNPNGDPVGLYHSYLKKAESAHEDDLYETPSPDFVISSFLRAMNLERPLTDTP
ncbi:MAG: hypothetical protein R3A80_14070 [Bdellovibrionota bacterium]